MAPAASVKEGDNKEKRETKTKKTHEDSTLNRDAISTVAETPVPEDKQVTASIYDLVSCIVLFSFYSPLPSFTVLQINIFSELAAQVRDGNIAALRLKAPVAEDVNTKDEEGR